MQEKKASLLWAVNVCSALVLLVLALTGFANWLILPKGRLGPGFLVSARHFFMVIHQWSALAFLVCIGIHVSLHASYVKGRLKRMGIVKSRAEEE